MSDDIKMNELKIENHGVIPKEEEHTTPEKLYERLVEKIKKYHPSAGDLKIIEKAYNMAREAHKEQKRKSGEPYIIHPLCTAIILADLELDKESIVAGLLHDVMEDTSVTKEQITKEFSEEVADLVDGVTKITKLDYDVDKVEEQAENLRKMFLAMAKDIRVILIKLADRLHNMRTLQYMTPEKQKEKSKETMEIYAPIADRLGISKIKIELDDLALRYLEPEKYKDLVDGVHLRLEHREEFMSQLIAEVAGYIEKAGIKATIDGRVKHYFSIYKKMVNQHKTLDQIYDVFAIRIIVDTVMECYGALGVIHEKYTPVPGRFKDYIAMPKPNGYRSIHMTVYAYGLPFEVQIRTHAMHQAAEYGIVAHWKYKQGETSGNMDQWTNWARKLIEEQQNSDDMEEFVRNLKNDARQDVGILTPKGKPIFLPKGSTPIDFAYRIHTEVGNRMIGAKVNGKLVPLDQPLQIGQICEIECSKDPNKGPNRDWLNIVKTTEARSKIRSWLKKERREENIQTGRKTLENELRRNHIRMENDEKLTELLHDEMIRYKCETLDDFLASVGYCGINVSNLIPRLKDRYDKLYKKQEEEKPKLRVAAYCRVSTDSDEQRICRFTFRKKKMILMSLLTRLTTCRIIVQTVVIRCRAMRL